MKHCRAFFNAIDDWIRRHPASLEPSGLFTAVWCLLQVTSILEFTESDWKTYLLLPGEDHHFTINHVPKVKSKTDSFDKLMGQEVSILGDMNAALSRLVSNPGIPFIVPTPSGLTTSSKNYLQSLEEQKAEVDLATIRLTKIRDRKCYLEEFRNLDPELTNGSMAKSFIFFPHCDSIEGSKSKQGIQVFESSHNIWRPQDLGFGHCIFAIVSILDNRFPVDKSELDVYRLALARLIVSLDEIVKQKDESGLKTPFDDLQRAVNSNDERWRIIKESALDFLNEHSKTEHSSSGKERLFFLRPSDQKSKYMYLDTWFNCPDRGTPANTFLGYADRIKSYFKDDLEIKTSAQKCPTCLKSFGTKKRLYDHRYKVHGYRAPKTSKGKRANESQANDLSNQPFAIKRTRQQPLPKKTLKVQQVDLISSGPDLSSFRTSEEDTLNEHHGVPAADNDTWHYPTRQMNSIFHDPNSAIPGTSSETDQLLQNVNLCESDDAGWYDPESEFYDGDANKFLAETNLFIDP